MKVRRIARRHRYLPPAVHQHPAKKPARGLVVGSPQAAIQRLASHHKVREKLIRLLQECAPTAQEIATDLPVHFAHEKSLRLEARVIGGQVVGEQLAILEYGVDR